MTPKLGMARQSRALPAGLESTLSGWDTRSSKALLVILGWPCGVGSFQEASAIYQEIAGQQNYFSLLATERLNQTCHFNHRPLSVADKDILNLRREPGIRRAVELFYLGRMPESRREWIFSLSGKGPTQLSAAAIIAHDMGWHERAIRAAADAGGNDDLIVSFPLAILSLSIDTPEERA
jgi:soluble lytic murein transglycosylase